MERYSHLQAMPNSPLTPLTPLSENTKFEFNFRGDGSLDEYINSIRQEHRVEQQQKKLLEHASRRLHKKASTLNPKRYSDEFLKIRDVFEAQDFQGNSQHKQMDAFNATTKAPIVKITYTTPTRSNQKLSSNNANKPTQLRTPLKSKNQNVPQNLNPKLANAQQQQKLQQKYAIQLQSNKPTRIFRQASPVAAKPLCPKVASILQRCGLSMYCGLFQKEEIDLFTLHLLKLQDLLEMGVKNQKHCVVLMHEIHYAGQYF